MVYKARNNSEIIRDNVILWIAEAVNKGDTYKHKVDLSNPDLVILVEIIKASQRYVVVVSNHTCGIIGSLSIFWHFAQKVLAEL